MVHLSKELCENQVRYGQIKYREVLIVDLVSNVTNHRSITVAGHLATGGTCKGTTYNDENDNYEDVIVTAKIEINYSESRASVDKARNKLILASGTVCLFPEGGCMESDDTVVYWTPAPQSSCKFEGYSVLFEGMGAKIASDNSSTIYFGNSSDGIQFGLAATGKESLCGYLIIKTEHPRMFILESTGNNNFRGITTLQIHNVLSTAYFNTKISYLSRHVSTQFNKLYLARQNLLSALSQARTDREAFAMRIMKTQGYTAIAAGE